jgi:hypothetical protein
MNSFLLGPPEKVVELLVLGLGIPLYIDDAGKITQHGPGRRIAVPDRAKPIPLDSIVESLKIGTDSADASAS